MWVRFWPSPFLIPYSSERSFDQRDGRDEEYVQPRQDYRRVARAGSPKAEFCLRHRTSEQTIYRWEARYSGMSMSDATKLEVLEAENLLLEKLLAERMLDVSAL